MGKRGPKPRTSFEELYFLAEDFYRDFNRLLDGGKQFSIDQDLYTNIKTALREQLVEINYHSAELEDEEDSSSLEGELERIAFDKAASEQKVGGDPTFLYALLKATSSDEVRMISRDAQAARKAVNWPLRDGSMLLQSLETYAETFIAAKNSPKYPKASGSCYTKRVRPTTMRKQLWFLSRALAGAVLKLAPRTAVNIIGSSRPEQILKMSRGAKPARRRRQ